MTISSYFPFFTGGHDIHPSGLILQRSKCRQIDRLLTPVHPMPHMVAPAVS
ncbi:MAG: hypothetical protein NZ578_14050 [Candidatus Binatia bacterium]|nr:hypothetical protein [Candidatus Binatia bacterium]